VCGRRTFGVSPVAYALACGAWGFGRAAAGGGVLVSAASGVVVGGLLEREVELARVDALLDEASHGVGAVVVVEGAAGIGKSELLAAVSALARARGFGVLRAQGSEFEAGIAFGVARQLFEPMLRAACPAERRRLLGGVARVGARALGAVAGEPPADRFAAIHGLFWLCANRAERGPLVVLVDDVQWVDDPSLTWLGYVARRAGDLALVVVLGLRSGDPGGGRGELALLVGDGGVQRLVLGPLSAAAVGVLVRGRLDDDAEESFCAAVRELSGGNPLLVRELLAAAREEGLSARGASVYALYRVAPSAVGTSVLVRLGRLGADAISLARAVAVLGAGAEVVLAARLAGMDPVVGELTADRLAAAQILAPVRPLEFFHPLIGAAVLENIAPGARRVAHRRAAALLEGEGKGSLPRVAAHLLACGPAGDPWVVQRLGDAAREALDRGAPEIAASYARRALSEPPAAGERPALLWLLGTAEWRAGQPDAIAHLEQARTAAENDHRALIGASGRLARAYYVTDRAERAVDVLEPAIAAIGDTDDGLALRLEAASALIGMLNERTAPAALRRAEALRGRLSALADPPVDLLVMLAYHAVRSNRADEAQELAERALACEPYPTPLGISTTLIVTLQLVERYDALQRLCDDLLTAARRRGAMQELAGISAYRAAASYDRGVLADAEADARWALERAEGVHRMHALTELIRVLVERDELQAAEELLEQSIDPDASRSAAVPRFLFARGRLHGAQGRLQNACDDLLECGQRCARFGLVTLSGAPWRGEAALVCSALGDTGEARRLAGKQLELARAFGRPRTLGISLRVCGLVEGGEAGLALLGEAVKTLERSQSPLELARVLSDYGAALRRACRRVRARTELERALDLAHRCGARRIAAGARVELIAAGAKPRRDAISGRDALTAGELRVARLAAEGLTNREIAQALFITTKTAKGHLSRVYRKLEITRRGQLPGALSGPLETSTRLPAMPRRFPETWPPKDRTPPAGAPRPPAARDSLHGDRHSHTARDP
jgi:DNA-binding CsgD family transcriptional regulator